MSKTCKDCEHYEPYDKDGWIMRCRRRIETGRSSDGLYSDLCICDYFTPKKPKSSYADRQAVWIEENDVKVGDTVKILRKVDSYKDGWFSPWVSPDMDRNVGIVGVVIEIPRGGRGISVKHNGEAWQYPYFVLEPQAKEKPIEKPKEERKFCTDCAIFATRWKNRHNQLDKCRSCLNNNHSAWQPKKPVEKPTPPATAFEVGARLHEEIMKAQAEAERQHTLYTHVSDYAAARVAKYPPMVNIGLNQRNKKTNKPTKSKENKTMNRLKKLIRRYVVGCTLYTTAILCIIVNPWLFRAAKLVRPVFKTIDDDTGHFEAIVNVDGLTTDSALWVEDTVKIEWNSGATMQVLCLWSLVVAAIGFGILFVWSYNKAVKWVFGKLETK